MKRRRWGTILLALALVVGFGGTVAWATPIISVDLDTTTPGIQSTRTLTPGDIFDVDVVLSDDGLAPTPTVFDTVILELFFNDVTAGGLTPGAITAGALAGTAPLLAIDAFGGTPVFPGSFLTVLPPSPPPGAFTASGGGAGYFSAALPFASIGPGPPITILSQSFTANTVGPVSLLLAAGTPFGSPPLAFQGNPITATLVGGTANVIPEPSTILLLGTGLAGLAAWRYKKGRKL